MNKGFTLVEVMVSVSIVSLMMLIVLFSYSTFSDNLALSAASQELSIGIRKSQTYGLAVKEVVAGGGQFGSAYGIFMGVTTPTEYIIFVDKDGNGNYDSDSGCGSGDTECIEEFTFRNGIVVSDVCDASSCPPSPPVRSMIITFLRPNPDATIRFLNNGGNVVDSALTGKVVLTSPKGKTATITVLSTGQISIE